MFTRSDVIKKNHLKAFYEEEKNIHSPDSFDDDLLDDAKISHTCFIKSHVSFNI